MVQNMIFEFISKQGVQGAISEGPEPILALEPIRGGVGIFNGLATCQPALATRPYSEFPFLGLGFLKGVGIFNGSPYSWNRNP